MSDIPSWATPVKQKESSTPSWATPVGERPEMDLPEASGASKALGFAGKVSNIFGFLTTAIGANRLKDNIDAYDKASKNAFKEANKLTQKAKQTTDQAEKERLLSEARAIMTASGEAADDVQQEIANYRASANITDEDLHRSNLDFAARRGGAAALEAGSLMIPGPGTMATTAGGRIAQAGLKGAASSGLSGAGKSIIDAETASEVLADTTVASILGALTATAFASASEAGAAIKAKQIAKAENKWIKPTKELDIKDTDIGEVIASNNSKKSYDNITKKHFSPQEQVDSFRKNDLARNDLLTEATDRYGNKYSLGEKILDDKTDDIFKNQINPVLKGSKETISKKKVLETLKMNKEGSLNPEIEEIAIKWVKDNLDDKVPLDKAYELKQQLMSGSFNKNGTPTISLNGQSSRSAGWAILGQVKENLPPEDAMLLQKALDDVTEAYAWKDVVTGAFNRYQKMALKKQFLVDKSKVASKVFSVLTNPFKIGEKGGEIIKELGNKPLMKFGQNIVEEQTAPQLPNVFTSLIGKVSPKTK